MTNGSKGSTETGKQPEKGTTQRSRKSTNVKGSTKKAKKSGRKQREKLAFGEMCKSGVNLWKVVSLLGSGGFGDVYKVMKEGDSQEYAMKTETIVGEMRLLRLKIEVAVMLKCNDKEDNNKHFIRMVDRGKTDKFKFIVMGLVGGSLEDYRKKNNVDFSQSTAMQITIQTLEALRDFHEVGYIHRDIKPHNFAYGLGKNETIIYIFDFGIARRIFDNHNKHKRPRVSVKYLGTLRYASRACHFTQEQGRKDDIETWFYMVCDIFDKAKGLAWRKETVEMEVVRKKLDFFKEDWYNAYYEEVCPVLKDLYPILDDQNRMVFFDQPSYAKIEKVLAITASIWKIDLHAPLDWTVRKEETKVDETQLDSPKEHSAKLEGNEEEEDEERNSVKVPKKSK